MKKIQLAFISRKELEHFQEDQYVFYSLMAGMGMVLLEAAFLIWQWDKLPGEIPLFYSQPWGEKQLVVKDWLWSVPLLTILIIGVNAFFIAGYRQKQFWARILATTALVFGSLMLITFGKIVFLVI